MSAIELLGESVQQEHGRAFTADQLKELAETFQVMQFDLVNQYARVEALTRLAVIAVDQLGGAFDATATLYEEATRYGLNVNWDEEKDVIHAETYEVEVPEVRVQDSADVGEEDGDMAPVPSEERADVEVASSEIGEG